MNLQLEPGKYVIAVSGGVDSVVLLDLVANRADTNVIVAHFDHGIREDSAADAKLVATLSQKYGVPYELGTGDLGPATSEEQAREARYTFLQQVRKKHGAAAIVTAHHQDDAVETLAFNVLRGTRRKGMSALKTTDGIIRPLTRHTKAEIKHYAQRRNLVWREDSTNSDQRYTRNWVRRTLLPRLSAEEKQQLTDSYFSARRRNELVDRQVAQQVQQLKIGQGLNRKKFIALPYSVAAEVMAAWLRESNVQDIDRKLVDLLVVSAKTLPPGKRVSVRRGTYMSVQPDVLTLS